MIKYIQRYIIGAPVFFVVKIVVLNYHILKKVAKILKPRCVFEVTN